MCFCSYEVIFKQHQKLSKNQRNTIWQPLPLQPQMINKYSKGLSQGKTTKNNTNNAVVFSAALQDHLMRKGGYKIDDGFGLAKTTTKLPLIGSKTRKQPILTKTEHQINRLTEKQKKSILPYESEALKKLKEAKSDEEKMNKYNKKLTWAQKLGIVEKPPLPLTAKDWVQIQAKSKQRQDSESICSICLEDFRIQPQVILSCSHVFHHKCLGSFQKHNKVHCCPICRRKDYEKKVIDEAIRLFTMKSILRIQRVFRGSRDRIKVYGQLVESGYVAQSKLFNRRLIGYKMWKLSNKITKKMKKDQQEFEKLFHKLEEKHKKETNDILEDMVRVQRQKILNEGAIQKHLEKLGIKSSIRHHIIEEEKVDWQSVMKKGAERAEDQCSICLTALWSRPVYLLSCTHSFHVNCIQGFERYGLPGSKNKCPCCRSQYEKKVVEKKK